MQENRKLLLCVAAVLLCIMLFCGCAGPRQDGNGTAFTDGTQPITPETQKTPTGPSDRVDVGLDEELQAAIDAHETKHFWRVEEPGSFPETVSLWAFDELEAKTLWAELKEGLIKDATDYTEQSYSETLLCRFKLEGRKVEARILPYEMCFTFITPKRAMSFGEDLTRALSDRLGLLLSDRSEEHTGGRKYAATPELDGLPLDLHFSTETGGFAYCGVWVAGKNAYVNCPIQNLRVAGQLSANRLLTPEDVRQSLLFTDVLGITTHSYQGVSVYEHCQPVYRGDMVTGTIRPTWRVSGRQYVIVSNTITVFPLELLVDALTGEVFCAEGTSGGL